VDLSADSAVFPSRANRLGAAWRVFANMAEAERDRWLLWLPVAVAAGVVVYFALPWEPSLWIAPAVLALAFLMAAAGFHRSTFVMAIALALASSAVGFGLAKLRTLAVSAPVLESRIGPVLVSGRVVSVEPWEHGARVILAQPHIAKLAPDKIPKRLRLRLLRSDSPPRIGQSVTLRAMLMPPTPPALPGAYDFGRQAYFQSVGGVGYAVGRLRAAETLSGDAGALDSLFVRIDGLRQAMNRAVMALVPGASGAMSAALITGDQSAIETSVMNAMRDAGLAHLLAISGFNVALVASVLFFGTRFLLVALGTLPIWGKANGWPLRFAIKKWAAIVTIFGILAYTLITGASVPTQRSFLMTAVVLSAILIDRTAISMRLVMWAALMLMAIAPESLLGASFQMSFAAVVALIAAYESWRGWVRAQRAKGGMFRKAGLSLAGTVMTTLVAAAATAPFAAYHFNRFALYQLVANFAAVPLTAIWIMPWATFVYFLMPFGLEHLALTPMSWGVDALIWLAQTVAAWPNAVMLLPSLPSSGLVLIVIGGLWFCLWRRTWRFAGILPIALGCATMLTVRAPDVLISDEDAFFAVRDGAGDLIFSKPKGQAFMRDVWQRRAGTASDDDGGETTFRCDAIGCIYHSKGTEIAFIRDSAALAEDCGTADVIVAWTWIRQDRCTQPGLRIDRRALAAGGGHALWLSPDGPPRVETVHDSRGDRPWSGAR
jgi:competence protein ComEC